MLRIVEGSNKGIWLVLFIHAQTLAYYFLFGIFQHPQVCQLLLLLLLNLLPLVLNIDMFYLGLDFQLFLPSLLHILVGETPNTFLNSNVLLHPYYMAHHAYTMGRSIGHPL